MDYYSYLRGVRQKYKELVPGEIYHIIQRAPGKELLFVEDGDYMHFLHLLKEMVEEFNFNVNAFCLMPNHVHIMGGSREDNFSEAMQFLFKGYALYFNAKYNRKGHVFHGPFRVVWVDRDSYMIILSIYIHTNPTKAGLCESSEEWRWSSIELYYHPKRRSFVDPRPVLSLLDDDLNQSAKLYRKMMSDVEKRNDIVIEPESRGAISSFLVSSFRYFAECFKNSYMKEEYKVLSELDKLAQSNKGKGPEAFSAKLYAVQQLSARGYDVNFICQLLGISRATCYRYLTKKNDETKSSRKNLSHSSPATGKNHAMRRNETESFWKNLSHRAGLPVERGK